MTRSAPIDRTRSTFLPLHTPETPAPHDLHLGQANVHTPPDAPLIKTFSPGRTFPLSRRACNAVIAAMGTDAACSKVMLAGFSTTARSARAHTYSAKAPVFPPNTSSPCLNCVTFLPTASTVPA